MADKNRLQDQIDDLFSGLTIPEPQAAPEIGPETAQPDLSGSLPQSSPPQPADAPETTDAPQSADALDDAQQTLPAVAQPVKAPREEIPQPDHQDHSLVSRVTRRISLHWRSSLRRKLIVAFLAAAIIPSLIISIFGIFSQATSARTNIEKNLELLATFQENQIKQWIQSQTSALGLLVREPALERQIRNYLVTEQSEHDAQVTQLSIHSRLGSFLIQHPEFDEVFLLDPEGQVIITTDTTHQDQFDKDQPYFFPALEGSYYGPPTLVERSGRLNAVVAEPLRYITGETIGILVGLVNPEPLTHLMHTAPGLGGTGETYLVNKDGSLVTSLRDEQTPASGNPIESFGIDNATAGGSGQSIYDNYDGTSVLGVYRWLPELKMALLAEREVTEAFGSLFIVVGGTLIVALVAVAVTALLGGQMAKRIAWPIVQMTESARQMVAGDLNQRVDVTRTDEIGALGQAFNHMAGQLQTTITGLEETVTERTQQLQQANYQFQKRAIHLEASADISRAAASILDPQELMQTTVNLIRDRFSFYHVSFFLLDDTGKWATVHASTGQVGQEMVALPHRLEVGGESMIGWACAQQRSRIALDVGTDAVHFDNPFLPNTRSEMVLPLIIGDQLLGALDVQSVEEAAFDQDDVRTLEGMAALVAVALQNARLFTATHKVARHQQLVARVSERFQRASTIKDIMQLTLGELGEIFDLAQATIRIDTQAERPVAGNGHDRGSDLVQIPHQE